AAHVTVSEKKKVAMLFQSVVLPCRFSTSSSQQPVVQWTFKSYCQDRLKDSLGFSDSVFITAGQGQDKRNSGWDPFLDCVDSSRTVRIVASRQGSVVTLGEYYKGREVTIINSADLQIGELQWGDSGVYHCVVITPDDLVGNNDDRMELLVLGRTGVAADLLPSFDVEFMPEWAFVGLVILGGFLFFLLVGICWCQCCPHSCCCYVRCPCCPNTCCCPLALYEAGKAAKAGRPPNVAPSCPPYYVAGVAMPPVPPPVMDKPLPAPLLDRNPAGGEDGSNMSELSSLHEGATSHRQPCRQVRKATLPTISDHEEDPEYRQPITVAATRRSGRFNTRPSKDMEKEGEEEYRSRWWCWSPPKGEADQDAGNQPYNKREDGHFRSNLTPVNWMYSQRQPRSEVLERKVYSTQGHMKSFDELADFAEAYCERSRRTRYESPEWCGRRGLQSRDFIPDPLSREGYYYHQEAVSGEYYSKHGRSRGRSRGHASDRASPAQTRECFRESYPPRSANGVCAYDDTYLSNVLEQKSKGSRTCEGSYSSESPSKNSSKRSGDGGSHYSRTPSYQDPIEDDSLPPYTERENPRSKKEARSTRVPYHLQDWETCSSSHERRERERHKKLVGITAGILG
uniref:Immunoglobulin like domain containing receptor 2 n=1 Tax=Latimeria chalumnae TaxID=7897 RepID=H3ABG1_LATCH